MFKSFERFVLEELWYLMVKGSKSLLLRTF